MYPVILLVLVLVIIVCGVALYDTYWGKKSGSQAQSGSVRHLETACVPRENVDNYLFEGLDVRPDSEYEQADTLLLLSVDHDRKQYLVLEINRDTMTDVPVLDMMGTQAGTEYQQIALAHTYSEDDRKNAINTVDAVSSYLGDVPIAGYYALDMEGIAKLTELAGGVPVVVESDFSDVDPDLVQGETVVLQGEQALTYVRSRKDVDDQTNIARMKRQRQFLQSLRTVLQEKEDSELIEIYDQLHVYSTSSIGSQTAVDLLRDMSAYEEVQAEIAGEAKVVNGHWAFYPEADSVAAIHSAYFCE